MVQSNYGAMTQGLKLYTDGMRRLIKQRLAAAFPNKWWEQGVLAAFDRHGPQHRNLYSNAAKDPDRDKIDLLDPGHFEKVIAHHFGRAFREVFHDYKKTQSWLLQAEVTRNTDTAHSRTGDMLADDVAYGLYAMLQILRAAELPEATDVDAIYRGVLGMPQDSTEAGNLPKVSASPRETTPARQGDLPYWWQVCTPRQGFRNPANIDESLFAATLGGVFAGAARDEFLDPVHFLSHTHFTENLTRMVRDTVSRLGGGDGSSVTEIQTPFGGGKTHALLTLYHLINSPDRAITIPGVRDALGGLQIPQQSRVLVFDGYEAGAEPTMKEDGASVSTLWGELTHQVGTGVYARLMMDSDGRGQAPGNAVFRQVLEEAAPCLILLDELVSYLVKLKFSTSTRSRNSYRQTVQFLQDTLQLVGNTPGVCILLSLPQSLREFGGLDPEQLQRELGILEEIQPRADRVVSKRTPVNDDEIYLLMSKRLFESVDSEAADRVVQAYRDIYSKTPSSYDPAVTSQDYMRQQKAAYPIHPELIDVLYKKWSTAPDFPRTRATLQLLASIIADQWANQREAYSIQSAHVNLERERIRTRIVSAAGSGGGFDGVIAADIIGGDAHADMQDGDRGSDYARHQIGRGVATTLLMHSFGGRERSGATSHELCLGTVSPNVGPEYVAEVLNTLEERLWYVHREGEALSFQTRPNIYRVIAQTAAEQPVSAVSERLRAEVDAVIGAADGFRVLSWIGENGQVPDNPEPSIAVLSPRFAVSGADGNAGPASDASLRQLWDRVGGGLRQWRNALILVTPDQELWGRAEEAVREVLAYDSVIASTQGKDVNLTQLELRDLRSRGDAKRDSLRTSVATAYRWVYYPEESGLVTASLAVPATTGEKIARRVVQRLSDQDYGAPKILSKMGAVYFNARVGPRLWKDEGEALDLSEALRRFPQWTFLPLLPNREDTLRNCIREGVSQKLWAVAIGDIASSEYQTLIETPEEFDNLESLFDGSASLLKGDLLQLVREELIPVVEPEPSVEDSQDTPSTPDGEPDPDGPPGPPLIPPPARRLSRVRLNLRDLAVGKTNNLQPYLFRVLQDQDAGAELTVTIEVSSDAGIPEEVLNRRIVEGLEQLDINIGWEEG